jgi:hypothetical protein
MDDGTWKRIDPAGAGLPAGFTAQVMASVRAEAETSAGWFAPPSLRAAPAWARAFAVVALVVGIAAGAGLAGWTTPRDATTEVELAGAFSDGLGESYWQAMETEDPAQWDFEAP